MELKDFYYELPEELIAQDPLEDRASSRLMVLHRESGEIEHKHFRDIAEYLKPGDCLVLNDTKVIPARLIGEKVGTGAKIEVLLLTRKEDRICARKAMTMAYSSRSVPRPTPTRCAIAVITEGKAIVKMAKATKARVASRRPAWWRAPPGVRSIIQPTAVTARMRAA